MEVVERVRRLFVAFNERDWDALSAELDPEVEYTPVEEHATFHGHEAFTDYLERWLEAWETFSAEAEEIEITPAEDHVFIAIRCRGSGKGSGVEINDFLFWVSELRGGRLYRISEYTARGDALEAAGLSE
ncbi:MAG: nuclear transport factor 2 family protein [Solirubrobacterales bacterium]